MKAFYASLLLFALLLAVIALNAVFVRQTAAALEAQLQEIAETENAEAHMTALWSLWQRRRTLLCLSVPIDTVEKMEDRLTELDAAIKSKDADGIMLAVRLSVSEARRLSFAERFSTENVF